MKLSEQQVRYFDTFGYLMLPALFTPEEMDGIIAEFEFAIQNFGGGRNHDGSTRTMFGAPIERTAKLCTLLDDPRITGLLSGLLGDDFNYCSGDGNYYAGDTGWHPDGNWGQKFAVNCTRHCHTEEDLALGRNYIGVHSPGGYNVATGAGMFFPPMLDTADSLRKVHLEQPAQLHDELFPHLARTA